MFELPLDAWKPGPVKSTKWVLSAADGQYLLGQFDGREFRKESGKHQLWHGNFYAAQTFSDTPSRRIQIGWGHGITFPRMPVNQQMTIPVELPLNTTGDGPRMFARPVEELTSLHGRKHELHEVSVAGTKPLADVKGDLFHIVADIEPNKARFVGFSIRGVPID